MPLQTATPNNLDGLQVELYRNGQGIVNDYTFSPGVCILPLAEDPPTDLDELKLWSPIVVLRLHAPYRIRKVRYEATKQNNPPIVPSPKDVGAFVFVGGSVSVVNAMNTSYYSFDWQIASEYTFVENCVSRVEDGLVLGSPPWVWQTNTINSITYPPSSDGIGAIAYAGTAPQVGYAGAKQIQFNSQSGYLYNIPEYLPGIFFNDYLVNGIPIDQTDRVQYT